MPRLALLLLVATLARGQQCVIVAASKVTAGALAATVAPFARLPQELVLGYAPAPGLTRWWRGSALQALAARNGQKGTNDEGPWSDVCVQRPSKTYTRDEVEPALRQALPPGATLELVDFCRLPMPEGTLHFELRTLARPAGAGEAAQLWRGQVRYEQGRSAPFWALARAGIERSGLVAAKDIRAGQLIRPEDVAGRAWRSSLFAPEPLGDFDRVVGMETRRFIAAGAPLTAQMLLPPREVSRGERVQAVVEAGGARLKFEGAALSSGRRGEMVLVENPGTGKRLRARVEGKGQVRVRTEDQDAKTNPGSVRSGRAGRGGAGLERDEVEIEKAAGTKPAGPLHPGT